MMIMRLIVFLATTFITCAHCSTDQEQWLRGHQLYQQNDFAASLESYQAVKNKGAATWYNMGNCAYKLAHYADARVFWKRAGKLAAGRQRDSMYHNIDVLDHKQGNADTQKSSVQKIYRWLESIISSQSMMLLQLLFLLLWYLIWLMIMRRQQRGVLASLLLITLATMAGGALYIKHGIINEHTGVIVQSADLFSGPDEHYHKIGSLNAFQEVAIEQERQEWCKVKYGDIIGWVSKKSVELI